MRTTLTLDLLPGSRDPSGREEKVALTVCGFLLTCAILLFKDGVQLFVRTCSDYIVTYIVA